MSFSIVGEILELGDVSLVFPIFLNDVGIYICCKGVVIATFLTILAPKTSLVLVYLAYLALVDRKLLILVTRYMSKGNVSGFSPFRVFLLFFHRLVLLRIP